MCSPDHHAFRHSVEGFAITPRTLAALGPVLCLHRESESALAGALRARDVRRCACIDSDGPRERLCFRDATGDECWRLYALPDSDLLAWEHCVGRARAHPESTQATPGLTERLWRGLADALSARRWRATAIRLHAVSVGGGWRLASSEPVLSSVGAELARRIVRAEGATMGAGSLSAASSPVDIRWHRQWR